MANLLHIPNDKRLLGNSRSAWLISASSSPSHRRPLAPGGLNPPQGPECCPPSSSELRCRPSEESRTQSPGGVRLLGRKRGRLQGAPPPPPPRLRNVGVAGTEAANTGSRNRSPRRAYWLVRNPTRQGQGRCQRQLARSPWRAATSANQLSAPIRRLTNPKPHWRNECATGPPGSDSGGFKHYVSVNG